MAQLHLLARPTGARLAWRILLASLASATLAFAAKPKTAPTRAVVDDDDGDAMHDHPLASAEWRTAQRAFPADAVPMGAYQTAHRTWEVMQQQAQPLSFATGENVRPHLGPPVGGTWTGMGPGPVDNGGGGGLGSGRTTAIVIDPTNVNTMYAGFADGGVWKSTDGGTSWKPLTDTQVSLAIGAIVLDPKAPNTIYVGTGEGNFAADVFYGHGILKSTDGGTTWTQLGADTFDSLSIPKMFIDASGALYVAAAQGVAGSGLGCQAVTADPTRRGLYKSTDGGAHFTQIVSGKNVSDFEFDPMASPPAGVLASFKDGSYRFQEAATGMATVTAITALPSGMGTITRTEFGRSKSNPKIIYAGVGYDTMPGTSAVFRSADNGMTWTNLNLSLNYCSDQCFYDNIVEVHPTDPDTVYLGGMTCPVGKITNGTTNASATCISSGLHSDTHVITLDPMNPTKVWTGSDGGISVSTNAGTSWSQKNAGIATNQLYNLCVDQNDDTSVIGCLQDNGIVQPSTVGSQTWKNIHGGDGMSCANNLGDPNTANRFLVTSVQYAAVARKTATGAYQEVFNAGMDRVNFIAPLTFDLTTPSDVYVGTYRVYKSTTAGTSGSFKAVSGDLTTGAMVTCGNMRMRDDVLGAIAAAGKRVYSGSFSGKIFTSPDGGTTWTDVTKPPLPVRYVSNFAIDPMNPSDVYVAFSGFSSVTPTTPGHVFHTTNAGQTWTRADQNLDIDLPVNAIARSPAGAIYIGHDFGVAGTLDNGQTWNAIGNGLPHVSVFALEYHNKTGALYAGTHGRSAWKLTFGPSLVASPASLTFFARPGQTPAAQTVTVSNGDPAGSVLNFTAAPMGAWLSVTPTTGKATGGMPGMPLSVAVNTTGLGLGNYMGSITLSASNATPTSISVPVVLQITDTGMPPPDAGAGTPDASIDASGPGATTGAGGSTMATTGAGGGSGGDNPAGTGGGSGTTMGTGGASAGSSGTSGPGTTSGAGGTSVGGGGKAGDDGGCGCRVGRSDLSRGGIGASLLLAWAACARMRRRRRA